MSILTRSIIGLSLLLALFLVAAGCRKQTAVNSDPIFPNGSQSVAANDPTLKAPEPPPAPPKAVEPEKPAPEATPPEVTPKKGNWQPPTQAEIDAARKAGTQRAVIKTAYGDIEVELYGKETPITVASFVKLIKAKFYDGLTFHRVEKGTPPGPPNFKLIQGGDPEGTGMGGPGYQIKREISPKLKHVAGALAMARSNNPDSAGSQFYICAEAIPSLDGDYAVFGKVTKGLEIVGKISKGDKMISIRMK